MSVSLRHSGALFLHIPKTGGSWVEHALGQIGLEIDPAETIPGVTYRHSPLPMLKCKHLFIFTFIRHPLSWYESWWKFQAGIWAVFEPGVWHPQRVLERCRSDDFSEFIRLVIEHEPGYVSRMYEWFIGPPGHDHVQFVGRQENLVEDLIDVLTILGHDIDVRAIHGIARANESQKRRGEPVWDPELRRKVVELEAPAIRRFYADAPEPRSRAVAPGLRSAGRAASPTPFHPPRHGGISSETPIPTEQEPRIAVSLPETDGPVEESARGDRLKPRRHVAADGRMGWRRAGIARRIGQCLRGR